MPCASRIGTHTRAHHIVPAYDMTYKPRTYDIRAARTHDERGKRPDRVGVCEARVGNGGPATARGPVVRMRRPV